MTFLPTLFPFNAPAPPTTPPLSLHDALPIYRRRAAGRATPWSRDRPAGATDAAKGGRPPFAASVAPAGRSRSEEHTSELQSRPHLVCRLLLEKKKKTINKTRERLYTRYTIMT